MIDFSRIKVIAGEGGRGAGSFVHIKGKRRGKADGGDGGAGGNVYFVASGDLNTLEAFRFVKEYKAKNGGAGLSKKRKGAVGQDREIKVPVGTVVRVRSQSQSQSQESKSESESGVKVKVRVRSPANGEVRQRRQSQESKSESEDDSALSTLTFDLVEVGQKVLVARGGEGGRGNAHLRDEFGRRPFGGEAGGEGEMAEVELELKLIADVGLVGLPNAGKSTLISALTSARPKIAPYPFTTLEPNLGVLGVKVRSQSEKSKKQKALDTSLYTPDSDFRLVLADIPGLIEGASEGRGLGDLFLRHIERTGIIVHLIDITGTNLWGDYQTIRDELKAYSKDLAKKKEIVVLNKADLVSKEDLTSKVLEFKSRRKRVICISAQEKTGLGELVSEIVKKLNF